MSDFDDLMDDLKRLNDEIRLRLHLASMEVKDEFETLEGRWKDFSQRAEFDETKAGLGHAFGELGSELKHAFERIRKAVGD